MSRKNAKRLLSLLSHVRFKSGEDIGSELGITRAAVAKQIKLLQELGVDVFSVQGKGYRLNYPVPVYDVEVINATLTDSHPDLLHIVDVIESTNDFVKSQAGTLLDGFVCIAEGQTKGRGRQGKNWLSPFGSSIYLSMKWGFWQGFQSLAGLSLVVGVALLRLVKATSDANVSLKWPNDVYVDGKKIAGILIEVSGNSDGSCDAIIGVGLNVRLPENANIDQPWVDLNSVANHPLDKNIIAAQLIDALRATLAQFSQTGLSAFKKEWEAHDHFKDQVICLKLGSNKITGVAKGISTSGSLLIEVEENGQTAIKEFSGGEVSVRRG